MSDNELTKKMLRSVLQSSKNGVAISRLQTEYKSLCGEFIPLQKFGFTNLEDYLKSISSVVRLQYHMGELRCFAVPIKETAHIAELVAKQKSMKKRGRAHVINCKMRFTPSSFSMFHAWPSSSLRQPSAPSTYKRYHGFRGFSAPGDYRTFDQKLSPLTPVEQRHPYRSAVTIYPPSSSQTNPTCPMAKQKESPLREAIVPNNTVPSVYDMRLLQSRVTQLLQKYSKGLWLSKLPDSYSQMFGQKLHPQAILDLAKWTHVCMVEQPKITGQVDQLIYPPLPCKPPNAFGKPNSNPSSPINSNCSSPSSLFQLPAHPLSTTIPREKVSPTSPLLKPIFIFPPQPDKQPSLVTAHSPAHKHANTIDLPPRVTLPEKVNKAYIDNQNLGHADNNHAQLLTSVQACNKTGHPLRPVCSLQPNGMVNPLLKVTVPHSSGLVGSLGPQSSTVLSADMRQKLKELLSKYSQGVWAHALPKLFMDTYQIQFPDKVINNLSLLLDICTVEYPMANNKNKAILYNLDTEKSIDQQETKQCPGPNLPSGLAVLGEVAPPPLVAPTVRYPSVLVTEAKSSNALTIRYVGVKYSQAQELMEDLMHSFYNKNPHKTVSDPRVGQLVAVRGEEEGELARAQVIEVGEAARVKVYYLDYGLSVETSRTHLLHLHQDFTFLPFQATNIRLAGLEAVSSHPSVLSTLEKLAVGKILLMGLVETCQRNETPVAILYDTSGDEDVNINSCCRKALRDPHMNNPLCVNVIHQNVGVTNVDEDGIIYCQLESRGVAILQRSLDDIEAVFISQNTSEFLVSKPFNGKFCLARYSRKWARAEITTIHSDRVTEILFIDHGVSATVEITDLREIPPLQLRNLIVIPPQATKCRLAGLTVPDGVWTPDAVRCLKEAVLGAERCKLKIVRKEEHDGEQLVHVYLFINADDQELHNSINHQLSKSERWQTLTAQWRSINTGNLVPDAAIHSQPKQLALPPPLELPRSGQYLDVFVSVACHPGYFVLQRWDELHKLALLSGEMVLYYNQTGRADTAVPIQKGGIYAAKIDKNWQRVQVKALLLNGFASVYELDDGKHELVHTSLIRPLIEEFRQLPFQAITAQLAGVKHGQWSEGAAMLFRNHVEKRALVAQVDKLQEMSEVKGDSWERKLTVYLVDTTVEEKDLWVHTIMIDIER